MLEQDVKIFNAKLVDLQDPEQNKYYTIELSKTNKHNLYELHNHILNNKNKLCGGFTPMEKHIQNTKIFSLSPLEQDIYKMNKNTIKQCKDLLDSQQRKQHRFEQLLVSELLSKNNLVPKDTDFYITGICPLSPIQKHIYDTTQQPNVCICCKERRSESDK